MEPHFEDHRLAHIFNDLQKGRVRAAEKKLLSVLEEDPTDTEALTLLVELYLSQGNWHAALTHARTLVAKLPPQDPRGYFALGCAQARLARFNHAIENLEKAQVLSPGHSEVLRNLGWVYCMVGEDEKGRAYLLQCLERDRSNVHACVDLAMSYHFRGEYETAKKYIARARTMDPRDAFARSQEQAIKETHKEFNALSPEEQAARSAALKDPAYLEGMRVEMLLGTLPEQVSREEIGEITEEMEALGLKGVLHAVPAAGKAGETFAKEYVELHKKVAPNMSPNAPDLSALAATLAHASAPLSRRKEAVVLLGAQGKLNALRILEEHAMDAAPELKGFFDLAIHECKTLLSADILGEPKISIKVAEPEKN